LRKKEGNVLAITGTDSPMTSPAIPFMDSPVGGKSNPMTLALRKTANSTAKTAKDNDNKPVIKEDVEVKISFDDEIFSGFQGAESGFIGDNDYKSLSTCIQNLLIPSFAEVDVHGKKYHPVKDVVFGAGVGDLVNIADSITGGNTRAMTLGLHVNYDAGYVTNLQTPTWNDLHLIIEEIAHVNQFLVMWANMPKVNQTSGGGFGTSQPSGPKVAPSYKLAQAQWLINYAAAVLNTPTGQDSYSDNAVEKPAQAERDKILASLKANNQSLLKNPGPCSK
jgi:hypothetical protein